MKTKPFIICSLLICLLLVCIPTGQAFAFGTGHMHPGGVSFDIPVSSADGLAVSGGAYLTSDISLNSDIVISSPLSICLNGYNINMGTHTISIAPSGSLSIYVCPDTLEGGVIIGSGEKAAFEVFGSINVLGGDFVTEGRPVIFNRAEANISGGKFSGDGSQLIQTSGSAILTVYGGEITASGGGTAVAMIAAPEDETAKPKDYNAVIVGGTVFADEGCPGSVLVNAPKGRFVINTGANITASGSPAIKVEAGSFDAYGGASVYSDSESAIVGTGGKIGLYFANITSDEKYGVDISENAELLLSGSLEIVGGNAGVRLAEGKVFSMSDYGFYGDVRVSIYTDVVPTEGNPVPISTPCEAKHYSHFLSATPSAGITYKDRVIYNTYDGSVSHSHEGRNYVLALNGSYTDLSKNNFYLENDLSCNGFYTGSVVNICLNGHTLSLGSAIKMYPNSTLNIYDCQGGGKIQANTTCIQDINNGSTKLILHQGEIVSNGGSPIKLTGGDTVIVKDGRIVSVPEGGYAIDATGADNTVSVEGGSIEGMAAAVKLSDGSMTVSGKPEGTFKGDYAVECSGLVPGVLTLDGNPGCSSGKADILLAEGKLLAVGPQTEPATILSVLSETVGDTILLSAASERDISQFFESADEAKAVVSGDENVIQLVRSLPASPESAEVNSGESVQFSVDFTGEGSATYQWYIRKSGSGSSEIIDGANAAALSSPEELDSGKYELYCVVTDESGKYVSETVSLTVKKDVIENISVLSSSELIYTGEPVVAELNASASTTMGRSVSFRYSTDGIDYQSTPPLVGPEPGVYTIYYIASAESCDDVSGQVSVTINESEPAETLPSPGGQGLSPRLLVIIASTVIFFCLCIVFFVQILKKKIND